MPSNDNFESKMFDTVSKWKEKNKIKKLYIHNNICITESDKHSILIFLKIFNIRSLYTKFLLQQCYMIAIIVDS